MERFREILASPRVSPDAGRTLGRSREGRPIQGFRFGTGARRVSLIGGCHADEPVGPRLLRHLCRYLETLPEDDPWLAAYAWWIVPHVNPDGEIRNQAWAGDDATSYELGPYLTHVVRELPGDDVEFGFPRTATDDEARPENRAVFDWWRSVEQPFALHGSLHGTGFAAGPWFLIEPDWWARCEPLRRVCLARVGELGYVPHDVERLGEKGFVRLGRGFCTRPDSESMAQYFRQRGDPQTADRFRPSSMETVRSFGGDPLTLVTEMPLFITPGVGEILGPPDPVAERWRQRIDRWRVEARDPDAAPFITASASEQGIRAMPVLDQMKLQWTFVHQGLTLV